MYGHHRNSGIHTLRFYGEALHKFESTLPIRGRKETIKPLGHRRNVDMYWMRQAEDKSIECILYKTPVITYYEDGRIIIKDDGYKSVSTANFIGETLGIDSRIFNYNLVIGLRKGEFIVPNDGVVLRRDDEGGLYPLNMQTTYCHKINRKNLTNVRNQYKDFIAYLKGMCKLNGGDGFDKHIVSDARNKYVEDDTRRYFTFDSRMVSFKNSVDIFMNLITDTNPQTKTESFYEALLLVVYHAGSHSYRDPVVRVTESKATALVDELLIGINRDTVLTRIEVPSGELKRDTYATYFHGGWNQFHTKDLTLALNCVTM
jgi:hypothetical protein